MNDKGKMSDEVCESCGEVVPDGKTGCVKLFEAILAREFSDYRYGKIHRLTVDSYALQHPDAYMRSGKSFAAHLTGMCAALEREDVFSVNQIVQRWLSTNPQIDKPAHLPEQRGSLTISYILNAEDTDEHIKRVREWAQNIWAAWSEHQDLARRLITEATAHSRSRSE
ncbi:MAG TPA: DUF5946 family protein [Pyrinomonadaceae bacterium]|nr:DUF5946 family protein [Pyrinomonadaceae bacterium]